MKKLFAVFTLLFSSTLFAASIEDFSEEKFKQLQAANAPILVDVHATWCPTCKQQGKVIGAYIEEHPSSKLTVLKVDYDKQRKWVKYFKAPRQSTLVVYQGEKEVGRVIAETNQQKLFNLFDMVK